MAAIVDGLHGKVDELGGQQQHDEPHHGARQPQHQHASQLSHSHRPLTGYIRSTRLPILVSRASVVPYLLSGI